MTNSKRNAFNYKDFMNNSILNKLKSLRNRYQEIEFMLTQKDIIANRKHFKVLSQEYLKLSKIIKIFIQ